MHGPYLPSGSPVLISSLTGARDRYAISERCLTGLGINDEESEAGQPRSRIFGVRRKHAATEYYDE